MHLLEITLCEELHKEEVAPEAAQFPLLCRVRDVCKVEHKLNEELLILAINFVEVEITVYISYGLHLAQLDEMLSHVRREHRLNDHVSTSFEIVAVHVDRPIARLILGHETEGSRQVMVLQHADIIMPNCNLIIHVDKEDVIYSRVLEIMQSCAYNATHFLQAIQFEFVFHAALSHEIVERLADVGCMCLVMISYAFITGGQMPDKAHKFIEIDVVCSD